MELQLVEQQQLFQHFASLLDSSTISCFAVLAHSCRCASRCCFSPATLSLFCLAFVSTLMASSPVTGRINATAVKERFFFFGRAFVRRA
jgi:hypothetical protein